MTMPRLQRITVRFPEQTPGSDAFLAAFRALLASVPGVRSDGESLHLDPRYPTGALPTTALTLAPVATPEIALAMESPLDLTVGGIRLCREGSGEATGEMPATTEGAQLARLPLATITAKLAGQITHVDHSGVNLPKTLVDDARWAHLLRVLAGEAALYRYPDGEPWPFILPTSDEEFRDDIRAFAAGRYPKFELVHDGWATLPVLQFALGTALSRAALETLFPEPYGVAFPDLAHIFRTVYVEHPWPNLLIRLDLYYSGPLTDWDTGEWLVTAGGRIRAMFG